VLYEMLTGTTPFCGEDNMALALDRLKRTPLPVSELCPQVPQDLSAIVMKALALEPDQRWTSAAEMAQALLATKTAHGN